VFGVLDRYIFPAVANNILPIRIGFILITGAALVFIQFFPSFYSRWAHPILSLVGAAGGLGIIWIIFLVSPYNYGDAYYAGLILVIAYCFVFIPLRFKYAFVLVATLIVAYNFSLLLYSIPFPVVVSNNFFLISAAVICGISSLNSQRLSLKRYVDEALILEQKSEIEASKQRADNLLRQILPDPIADRLLNGSGQIADGYADVTVLFADLCGFTEYSSSVSPRALVKALNRIFSSFDDVATSFGVEKVKTIGDAYMAVCGLPLEVDDHPERMVKMALGMCTEMEKIRTEFNGIDLEIRIGIHTGPCVAGVIGRNRFIYDLWGDTVNIASRMESTGVTGRIQISEATYLRVKNHFEFDARGQTQVKGRGMLTTYLVRT